MKARKELLLVIVSLLTGLGLAESAARIFGFGGGPISLEQAGASAGKAPDASSAMRYVASLPVAPGTDRQWFLDSPPPVPNRGTPRPEARKAFDEYRRRGLFAAQASYIWNRYFVEAERCRPQQGRLKGFPPTVEVFEPVGNDAYPRYRFPAATTSVFGLVTNDLGLRGRPLTVQKPPRTIRIAFVGASTTVGFHHFSHAYPEYVEYWLNRYAEASQLNVRFESLNGGREGIASSDIAAILRQELLPLAPDLTVYYEGANQFHLDNKLDPMIPARDNLDPRDELVQHRIFPWLSERFVLAGALDRVLNGFHSAGEPRKPSYRFAWPQGLDERNPDPRHPDLPLHLSEIVRDLDSIRTDMESVGGHLAVCSFEWLVSDRMPLSPTRNAEIYRHLNTYLWPLRYRDARRLADFQNRVFRNYAATRNLTFIDVARQMPQAPNLFIDAIHTTEIGTRLHAWIVFQHLVPWLRQRIDAGQLPRAAAAIQLPRLPSFARSTMGTACEVPQGPFESIPDAILLAELLADHGVPAVEPGPPSKVTTNRVLYGFGARAPFHFSADMSGALGVLVTGRSISGKIGLGMLDRQTQDLQTEVAVLPSEKSRVFWVPVLAPERATALVIRNLADGGVPSQMLVDEIKVVRSGRARKR